jgi:hypothetical protein
MLMTRRLTRRKGPHSGYNRKKTNIGDFSREGLAERGCLCGARRNAPDARFLFVLVEALELGTVGAEAIPAGTDSLSALG